MREYTSPYSEGTLLEVTGWDDRAVAQVPLLSEAALPRILSHAASGAEAMRRMPVHRRAELLSALAHVVKCRADAFAAVICDEAAKPIRDAETEVQRAVTGLTLAAEEAKRLHGETLPLDLGPATEGRFALTRRFPLGVVLAITPYNFPLNLGVHKVGPALAVGNSVVWKPSLLCPGPAMMLAEAARDVGYPEGALIAAACTDAAAEQAAAHPAVRMVSFTGSARVGWHLRRVAAEKRTALELGGNSFTLIDETADVQHAVSRCVAGGFAYSGQVCISVQHVLVHHSNYRAVLEGIAAGAAALKMGDPHDPEVRIGPMINRREAERVALWIDEAVEQGAVLHTGGRADGRWVHPAVLSGVPEVCRLSCEEAFGPVVLVDAYSTLEEAFARINRSRYGLQAGVFSRRLDTVLRAFHTLEVGGVIVNDVPTQRVDSMPYGGVKQSGLGREGIRYAMEEMSEIRLLSLPTD
jgi:glyceraldehyde-3-phosphate dehydrogenase (NADP+)